MTTVKVTQIPGGFAFDGASFGPFEATEGTPFTEVPRGLADILGLPRYEDGEADADADTASDQPRAEGDSARVAELEQRVSELQGELATARARIAELEGTQAAGVTPSDAPTTNTPLVDGLPSPELLTANGFDTMEKLAAGLVVPDGATDSPVQAVSGIGKKSVEAYQKAVTDWTAERA